jgi:uncharacterized iron-regulated membrane protein
MKVTLYKIHKWVGLALGVLLLLQALTGLLMAHKESLSLWFGGDRIADSGAPHQPLDRIISVVRDQSPGYRFDRIIYREDPALPLIARIVPPDGGTFHIAMIDPTVPAVLSSGPLTHYPLQLAERLHVSLLSGDIGHNILLFEGIALVFMGVSGLIVWWPRKNKFRKALTIKWKSKSLPLLRDLHMVPGALTAVLMLLAGLTGAMLIADPVVKAAVSAVAPVKPEIHLDLKDVENKEAVISWQEAFDRLHQKLPDGRLRQLRFMGGGDRLLGTVMVAEDAVNPRAHHIAAVDRWVDETIVFADGNDLPSGSAFMEWLLPLHTGEAFGPLRGTLMTILGLSLGGMSITGFMVWWKKRPRRRPQAPKAKERPLTAEK